MATTIEPTFFTCLETSGYLSTLEDKIRTSTGENADLLLEYPVVYLHVWQNKNDTFNETFHIYVGEADNVIRRQGEHWAAAVDDKHPKNWQHAMANDKDAEGKKVIPELIVIGHPYFTKSMTLDIENRLINYCLAMNTANLKNARLNPQGRYSGDENTDRLFGYIWRYLKTLKPKLFLPESQIMKSAIYKASPNHKLTTTQKQAKRKIIERVYEGLIENKDHQLIMVEGEAGTGKTVLTSSTFYDLLRKVNTDGEIEKTGLEAYLLVNHDEQKSVYANMAIQMGYDNIVWNPTSFIKKFSPEYPVDIVFIDEAHLLWTQKKQTYNMGNNQLKDVMDRARLTVIMFDENQALRKEQFIEPDFVSSIRELSKRQKNHIPMDNQLRMNCAPQTMEWIDGITKKQVIKKLPKDSKGYEVRIFDTPAELHAAIKEKFEKGRKHSEDKADELSRLIASYDWPYNSQSRPEKQTYWEVQIPGKDSVWSLPWNRELAKWSPEFQAMPRRKKIQLKKQDWAEQEQTINEVGSTFTIQGFDLSYAGVIIGPSVYYDPVEKCVKFDVDKKWYDKMKGNRTLADGTKQNVGDILIKNELRVLLTRGTQGLYIYACDAELRKALKEAVD